MSFLETLVILIVAMIVFGPKKMPEVARKIGHWMGMLRQARENFQRQLMEMDRQVNDTLNRAGDELDHLLPSDEDLESAVTQKRTLTPRDFTLDAPDEIPPPYTPPVPNNFGAPPTRTPDDDLEAPPVPGGLPPEPTEEPKPEGPTFADLHAGDTIVTGPYPSMAPGKTPQALERRILKPKETPPPEPRSLGLSPTKVTGPLPSMAPGKAPEALEQSTPGEAHHG